jgi:diguanylate cyclase (GGDEF)-like protein
MIINLREHEKLQHWLLHRDSLTGLRNTTAYESWRNEFNVKIQISDTPFGVAVFDINNLKEINDTYGHTYGNELILTASRIICNTFKRSPVFRIGGDEFCAILQGKDLEEAQELFESFDSACLATCVVKDDVRFSVSIAKGFSEFEPEKDTEFSDVFERADSKMYQNKRDMKIANE